MKLATDTLDDRREVWRLLHRLPPKRRVLFLKWAAEQAEGVRGNKPVHQTSKEAVHAAVKDYGDGADVRLTTTLYTELGMLYTQWQVDPAKVSVELERVVRSYEREES